MDIRKETETILDTRRILRTIVHTLTTEETKMTGQRKTAFRTKVEKALTKAGVDMHHRIAFGRVTQSGTSIKFVDLHLSEKKLAKAHKVISKTFKRNGTRTWQTAASASSGLTVTVFDYKPTPGK